MKLAARVALVVIALFGATVVVAPFGTPDALADVAGPVPTPLLSDLIGEPEPKESEQPGGGGGGSNDDEDDPDPNDSGGSGDGSGDGSGKAGGDGRKGDGKGGGDGRGADGPRKGRKGDGLRGGRQGNVLPPAGTPSIPGSFNTDSLMTVAGHLRSLGWSAQDVIEQVFPPFIVAGEATWVDTWGAPRYGPGPLVRTHEGQDVFCDYGDPVLAPVEGIISMSDGGLGGITSRVHLSDGSYWYLTHLSDWNTEEFANGDAVERGDVIGYCGNSGNALTTPPHVHFGWYMASGKARNPMRSLVSWLREAESRAVDLVASVESERQKKLPIFTAARRFGDAFAPDRSVMAGAAGESLWASGGSPATGAFALAEAALQAALSESSFGTDVVEVPAGAEGAGSEGLLDPDSSLARLLERRFAFTETGD